MLWHADVMNLMWHNRESQCEDVIVLDFKTTSMEMQAVADKFDRDGDGFIDYKQFIAALRPDRPEVTVLSLSVIAVRPKCGLEM